ncbi:aldo-keto reductase family protein [Skeletonema marinoi]|uniref:Aldo-keto reductase family protein n=1 Tax=Skeletonema marinoi TaxID=267567 RepID=A0AAD8YKZ4_9STRA|nr:aldo-keto reductase family protein [Skeletonema marinoi]
MTFIASYSRLQRSSSSVRMISSSSILGLSMLTAAANALSTTSSAATTNICNARYLGKSDLLVSESCLGTMTFGIQNNDDDAFQQLDYATSTGCNFIDTAELYPVPLTSPEYRAGATEEILGRYIAKDRVCREDLVIATKICGYSPNSRVAAARSYPNEPISPPPDCRLDSSSVKNAVDASLRRLNTDYIDLYQIHWPDRYVPSFGMTTFQHTQAQQREDDEISILETASALKDMIDEGKIRYIGLSNESTFGVCQWINACEQLGIRDKLATIQNSYNLLDRRFDSELAEACHHYDIGLLPWSVLAGGLLSGKYNKRHNGSNVIITSTSNSRFVRFGEYMKRWHPNFASKTTLDATEEYAKIASDAGLTPSELAIGFVRSREFVKKNGSVIVGATTMDQLKENLAPFVNDVALDEEVLARINEVHLKCKDPCCSL